LMDPDLETGKNQRRPGLRSSADKPKAEAPSVETRPDELEDDDIGFGGDVDEGGEEETKTATIKEREPVNEMVMTYLLPGARKTPGNRESNIHDALPYKPGQMYVIATYITAKDEVKEAAAEDEGGEAKAGDGKGLHINTTVFAMEPFDSTKGPSQQFINDGKYVCLQPTSGNERFDNEVDAEWEFQVLGAVRQITGATNLADDDILYFVRSRAAEVYARAQMDNDTFDLGLRRFEWRMKPSQLLSIFEDYQSAVLETAEVAANVVAIEQASLAAALQEAAALREAAAAPAPQQGQDAADVGGGLAGPDRGAADGAPLAPPNAPPQRLSGAATAALLAGRAAALPPGGDLPPPPDGCDPITHLYNLCYTFQTFELRGFPVWKERAEGEIQDILKRASAGEVVAAARAFQALVSTFRAEKHQAEVSATRSALNQFTEGGRVKGSGFVASLLQHTTRQLVNKFGDKGPPDTRRDDRHRRWVTSLAATTVSVMLDTARRNLKLAKLPPKVVVLVPHLSARYPKAGGGPLEAAFRTRAGAENVFVLPVLPKGIEILCLISGLATKARYIRMIKETETTYSADDTEVLKVTQLADSLRGVAGFCVCQTCLSEEDTVQIDKDGVVHIAKPGKGETVQIGQDKVEGSLADPYNQYFHPSGAREEIEVEIEIRKKID
jgi:hypothetical protein